MYDNWIPSPITQNMKLNDVCVYKQGDVNKTGKEGKTSWDTSQLCTANESSTFIHTSPVYRKQTDYMTKAVILRNLLTITLLVLKLRMLLNVYLEIDDS